MHGANQPNRSITFELPEEIAQTAEAEGLLTCDALVRLVHREILANDLQRKYEAERGISQSELRAEIRAASAPRA